MTLTDIADRFEQSELPPLNVSQPSKVADRVRSVFEFSTTTEEMKCNPPKK